MYLANNKHPVKIKGVDTDVLNIYVKNTGFPPWIDWDIDARHNKSLMLSFCVFFGNPSINTFLEISDQRYRETGQ